MPDCYASLIELGLQGNRPALFPSGVKQKPLLNGVALPVLLCDQELMGPQFELPPIVKEYGGG